MFQVIFERVALDEVGAQWAGADDDSRSRIGRAFQSIVQQLKTDPYANSESREGDFRILIEPPLGVIFRVDDDTQVVHVPALWIFDTH